MKHIRPAALLALLTLAVAGCDRKADTPEQPAAASQPAQAAAVPLSYEATSADAEVSLTLPEALRAYPELHRRLYDREASALSAFAKNAVEERRAMGMELPPYSMEVVWRVAAETDRLLSLTREESNYSGGAHPNSATTTLIWDKQAGREAPLEVLFPAADAYPALENRLCEALKAEKAERGGVPLDGDNWTCPKWKDVNLALAPATTRGKAGGVTALLSPYEVGPYVEGAYEITLPTSAVASAVAPAYRGEFAG